MLQLKKYVLPNFGVSSIELPRGATVVHITFEGTKAFEFPALWVLESVRPRAALEGSLEERTFRAVETQTYGPDVSDSWEVAPNTVEKYLGACPVLRTDPWGKVYMCGSFHVFEIVTPLGG